MLHEAARRTSMKHNGGIRRKNGFPSVKNKNISCQRRDVGSRTFFYFRGHAIDAVNSSTSSDSFTTGIPWLLKKGGKGENGRMSAAGALRCSRMCRKKSPEIDRLIQRLSLVSSGG